MKLPIDVVPNTNPPTFRWTQTVGTLGADAVQDCEGMLPPSCERAVEAVIKIARTALEDNVILRSKMDSLQKRLDGSLEVLASTSKRCDQLNSELQQLQQRESQRQKTAETKVSHPQPNKR